MSPDGKWIAEGGVTALETSPDGRTLISGGADRTLLVWNAKDGIPMRRLETGGKRVMALTSSHEGRHLALRGADGELQVWDAERWEVVYRVREPHPLKGAAPLRFHPFVPLLAYVDPRQRRACALRLDLIPSPASPRTPNS